jgi:hypothetical protein
MLEIIQDCLSIYWLWFFRMGHCQYEISTTSVIRVPPLEYKERGNFHYLLGTFRSDNAERTIKKGNCCKTSVSADNNRLQL